MENLQSRFAWPQDDEIENDITLKLQAMKMYLEHMSNDQISKNLRVKKVIVEKWISSFKMSHAADSDCEMIYEIYDDSSESNNASATGKNETLDETSGLASLRWSESSESDETRSLKDNSPPTDNNSTASVNKPDDKSISMLTPTRQLRQKRPNLKLWKEVPCRCTVCKEKFVSVNDLRVHVRKQHHKPPRSDYDSDDKRYGCGLCFKAFNLFGKLIHHSISAHVPNLRLK